MLTAENVTWHCCAMPDGFNPGPELQRIQTWREVIMEFRARTPVIMAHFDAMLQECATYSPMERLALLKEGLDRGFGKVTQSVKVMVDPIAQEQADARVKLYLPDNGRGSLPTNPTGKTIDA